MIKIHIIYSPSLSLKVIQPIRHQEDFKHSIEVSNSTYYINDNCLI